VVALDLTGEPAQILEEIDRIAQIILSMRAARSSGNAPLVGVR
jgi:hypothetical protein